MAKGIEKGGLCSRCKYRSEKEGVNECDYCFLTGHSRGCPGDENCARFEEGPRINMPLPGPAPAESRMAEKDLALYDRDKRQRIYSYKKALHSYAESKE